MSQEIVVVAAPRTPTGTFPGCPAAVPALCRAVRVVETPA